MSNPDFRNDPAIWKDACQRLLNTIDVIERGRTNSTDLERSDASLSAMMLAGFAFENSFKAKFLHDGGVLYKDDKLQCFKNHDFVSWADDHDINYEGWEREALDKAAYFCVAWGRYPAHNRAKKERPFETWGWDDVEQLKNLIHRLNDQHPNKP